MPDSPIPEARAARPLTESVVERAARARYEAWVARERADGLHWAGWNDLLDEDRAGHMADERAALAAMREPTAAMCDAATASTAAFLSIDVRVKGVALRRMKIAIRWRASIDAALSEADSGRQALTEAKT